MNQTCIRVECMRYALATSLLALALALEPDFNCLSGEMRARAAVRSCVRSCGHAFMRSCGRAFMRSCGRAVPRRAAPCRARPRPPAPTRTARRCALNVRMALDSSTSTVGSVGTLGRQVYDCTRSVMTGSSNTRHTAGTAHFAELGRESKPSSAKSTAVARQSAACPR